MVAINSENTEDENTNILLKQVPSYLFPFARGIVTDLTKDSGFPPFVLAPIDFDKVEVQKKPEVANNN